MNMKVARALENYFHHVPSARAALDNLCADGCDETTILEFVGFLRFFKEGESRTTSAKYRIGKPSNKRKPTDVEPNLVARRLAKDAAMLSQLHQSGAQFFIDLAAAESDLKELRHLSKLKKANKLEQSGGYFYRGGNANRPRDRRQGSVNLLNLSEQMASLALLLQEAASYRLAGISDLVQKNLLNYVREKTGRAHYDDLANLFPDGAQGEGHFSPDALKQWAHEHQELPCTTPSPR